MWPDELWSETVVVHAVQLLQEKGLLRTLSRQDADKMDDDLRAHLKALKMAANHEVWALEGTVLVLNILSTSTFSTTLADNTVEQNKIIRRIQRIVWNY